jgi:predicted N-formylglutamate amidohydrolase
VVEHSYTPDWKIKENVYIETKGLWKAESRAMLRYLKEQHPEVVVYMVFQNPNNKLNRASKTTYSQYCDKHGIPWATIDSVPEEWFQ